MLKKILVAAAVAAFATDSSLRQTVTPRAFIPVVDASCFISFRSPILATPWFYRNWCFHPIPLPTPPVSPLSTDFL